MCYMRDRPLRRPLRHDPNVIRWVTFVGEGLGAPRVRSCARRERGERSGFRAECARGIRVWTFQCSLRTQPAPLVSRGRSWGRSQICVICGTDPSDTTPT